ncbi:hypothetical protein FALBO_14073 [Fusarium albosuccineum]|uniref:Uncharacterized protein n=1 Tax=Fusarium albosuccineum TaxID=1237068 RepID=A0A8H4KXA0_9HYPO|nr:hypothetical protein FALBO_14073 [Fusarium albosuccineum]
MQLLLPPPQPSGNSPRTTSGFHASTTCPQDSHQKPDEALPNMDGDDWSIDEGSAEGSEFGLTPKTASHDPQLDDPETKDRSLASVTGHRNLSGDTNSSRIYDGLHRRRWLFSLIGFSRPTLSVAGFIVLAVLYLAFVRGLLFHFPTPVTTNFLEPSDKAPILPSDQTVLTGQSRLMPHIFEGSWSRLFESSRSERYRLQAEIDRLKEEVAAIKRHMEELAEQVNRQAMKDRQEILSTVYKLHSAPNCPVSTAGYRWYSLRSVSLTDVKRYLGRVRVTLQSAIENRNLAIDTINKAAQYTRYVKVHAQNNAFRAQRRAQEKLAGVFGRSNMIAGSNMASNVRLSVKFQRRLSYTLTRFNAVTRDQEKAYRTLRDAKQIVIGIKQRRKVFGN